MVVPSEELYVRHGLPNWAICVTSRHHERSILWSADSICADCIWLVTGCSLQSVALT
jgi:hypothetical protein